jgi:hypothetical protein
MSVETAVSGLITDIDQLNRLYSQLFDVPDEVRELIRLLADSKARLILSSRLLAKTSLEEPSNDNDILTGKAFNHFRSCLLDLELFLDPEQWLHRSGAGAQNQHSVGWDSFEHGDTQDFCFHFKEHIFQLDSDCSTLITFLNA